MQDVCMPSPPFPLVLFLNTNYLSAQKLGYLGSPRTHPPRHPLGRYPTPHVRPLLHHPPQFPDGPRVHRHRVAAAGLLQLGILKPVPGTPPSGIASAAGAGTNIIEDLVRQGATVGFFPHGVGHYLGLDVSSPVPVVLHAVGQVVQGLTRFLVGFPWDRYMMWEVYLRDVRRIRSSGTYV
jgi:hypothetical protein